jgi:hypothetical protein
VARSVLSDDLHSRKTLRRTPAGTPNVKSLQTAPPHRLALVGPDAPIVHGLAGPACAGGALIDVYAALLVRRGQLGPMERMHVIRRDAVEALTVWMREPDRAVVEHMDHDSALVDNAVVESAE